jgi:hypothetical protein
LLLDRYCSQTTGNFQEVLGIFKRNISEISGILKKSGIFSLVSGIFSGF